MQNFLLVAVGGALGSVARYGVTLLWPTTNEGGFPWATLIVNVTGSFAMGVAYALSRETVEPALGRETSLFVMTGVLGGYTTFSAFSLQTFKLLERNPTGAMVNVVGSVSLCLAGVWAGFLLTSWLRSAR